MSNSVIVVSIGRLVSIANAGAGLEADLTWSTITYLKWVQCEGPLSVISVCLPNIFNLCKLIYTHGLGSVLRRGKSQSKEPYFTSSNDTFIRMETHSSDRREMYRRTSEELETDPSHGRNTPHAPGSLNEQWSTEEGVV